MTYTKADITELDFEFIKSSLKTFLQNQSTYNDYDFEGSGMSAIIDLLSHNTSMNAFMASMMGNEAFIDSAQLRESVVSLAKQIGYVPYSVTASRAIINITVPNVTGSPSSLLMPAGTRFTNALGILFTTVEDYVLYPTTGSSYAVSNVNIYEGTFVDFDYTVNSNDIDQKFIVPAVTADASTLTVSVRPNYTSSSVELYTQSDNINVLTRDSKIYFLQENLDGYFEVYFGDDVIGKKVSTGNVVHLSYVVPTKTDGSANKITNFLARQSIEGYGTYTITSVLSSYGGSDRQSIDDVRHIAPKMYQTQNRTVIKEDYVTFLLNKYPWISSLNVWGGENNVPPVYGKVFICIQPSHVEILADAIKDSILNDLIKNYNVVTVIPEIVDPSYLYIGLTSRVYYTLRDTVLTSNTLSTMINSNITSYFNTIKKFGKNFNYSPVMSVIDKTEQSITSSLVDVTLQVRIQPVTNIQRLYSTSFSNAIIPGTVTSSTFNPESVSTTDYTAAQYIVDDGLGKLYTKSRITGLIISNDVGTVDYTTGDISITIIPFTLPSGTVDVRINAVPVDKNIYPGYNQIILEDDTGYDTQKGFVQGISTTMIGS
jgi:hypothetical protein